MDIHASDPRDSALGLSELTVHKAENVVGGGHEIAMRVGSGPCRGALTFHDQLETGVVSATVDVQCSASDRWWDGKRLGLRGEGTVTVGLELPGFSRALACAMADEWWTAPHFLKVPEPPPLTQFFLWQCVDGSYGVIVPLVGDDTTTYVSSGSTGMELRISTLDEGRLRARGPVMLAAFGRDPYTLVERAYAAALQHVGGTAKLRTQKRYPECFEYLGWCTWDAFYRDVDSTKVRQQLQHFRTLGLPVGFLLIDDGWYPMRESRMTDTRTDLSKFPGGLEPLLKAAKTEFSVPYVGVWQAMTGYWSGIDPEHTLAPAYHPHLLTHRGGQVAPAMSPGGAFEFWNLWHAELASLGADFVKIDGQGAIHRYSKNVTTISAAARDAQRGLQASVGAHFNGNMINCMSMSQELAWNFSMSNVTRSSNDYMINGDESDPSGHACSNAYNSLWLSQLSWCDWDMFRTDQASAEFQAMLRAISGGPIYVSDGVGVTRPEKLFPLILSSGRVLRCDRVGLPTADCLLRNPQTEAIPLKIMNAAGSAGVLALFNVQQSRDVLRATVSPTDLPWLEGASFAVWHHGAQAGQLLGPSEQHTIDVLHGTPELFVLQPVVLGFAAIGLVHKLISPKTIRKVSHGVDEVLVWLEEGGTFVAYSERRPSVIHVCGQPTDFDFANGWIRIVVPPLLDPILRLAY